MIHAFEQELAAAVAFFPEEKPQDAEVIAVGPGAVVDDKVVPMEIKVGEKLLDYKW